MINVVIPMTGPAMFLEQSEFKYPKPLIEMGGKTMLEHVVKHIENIEQPKRFIFIIDNEMASKFFLENVIKLVAGKDAIVIRHSGNTRGAVCSALLAIDYIENKDPLVITNCDQVIESGLNEAIKYFKKEEADAGLVCFESVHPKWSYALTSQDSKRVVEVAEKKPISNNSIAGFYYYKNGNDFVESAKKTILKDANVGGNYYISLTYNEMILANKKVLMHKIDNKLYHSFYSVQKVKEYSKHISANKNSVVL